MPIRSSQSLPGTTPNNNGFGYPPSIMRDRQPSISFLNLDNSSATMISRPPMESRGISERRGCPVEGQVQVQKIQQGQVLGGETPQNSCRFPQVAPTQEQVHEMSQLYMVPPPIAPIQSKRHGTIFNTQSTEATDSEAGCSGSPARTAKQQQTHKHPRKHSKTKSTPDLIVNASPDIDVSEIPTSRTVPLTPLSSMETADDTTLYFTFGRLDESGSARVFFVPSSYRSTDHLDYIDEIHSYLPA